VLTRPMLRKLTAFLAAAAAALTISCAAPAAEYPTHPVTILVAFTPGGPSDVLSRIVGKRPPDFPDRSVDRGVLVDEDIRTPERLLNLSAIHKATGVPDEEDQHLHWNLFELYTVAAPAQRVRRNVEF